MHGDDLIGPWIETQKAGERHGCLLLEVCHVELGTFGHHGREPEGLVGVALGETVADHGLVERLEGLDALLKLLEVEAKVLLAVDELLGAQELEGFLGGCGVVGIGVVHGDAVEDGVGGEEQAIVEGVLGIQAVGEDDVRDLEGEDSVEIAHLLRAVGGDDGGGVEQALGDDDGVADGDGLQRLGKERAATNGAGEGDVVVSKDVAGKSFQGLVELAGCIEEASLEEALEDIILCLLDPGALCAERADILGVVETSVAPTTSSEALAASAGGTLRT